MPDSCILTDVLALNMETRKWRIVQNFLSPARYGHLMVPFTVGRPFEVRRRAAPRCGVRTATGLAATCRDWKSQYHSLALRSTPSALAVLWGHRFPWGWACVASIRTLDFFELLRGAHR